MRYLLIALLFLATNAHSQANSDSVAIVRLLENDYKTLANWDITTHVANCTNNYMVVENGEIWDLNKESEYFKNNSSRVITRTDHFEFKYIGVFWGMAYAVYTLKSGITEKGQLTEKAWVESAIFRKINGQWKIELIHSTPVPVSK